MPDGATATPTPIATPAPSPAPSPTPTPAPTPAPGDGGTPAPSPSPSPTLAPTPTASWPDDWRQQYSGKKGTDGEKLLKRLERYASPEAALDALIAAQNKISSGELKSTVEFPANGTDADKATWRKENGIPEAADKYDLKYGEMTVTSEEIPNLDKFLSAAHEANLPPAAVKASVKWYLDTITAREQAQQESDAQLKQATEDALRTEWGGDYRGNVNRAKALLQTFPGGLSEMVAGARLPDGTALFNNPEFLRAWVGIARQLNPSATIVPGDGQAVASQIDARLAEIKGWMSKPRGSTEGKKYWKDEKVQAEYRQLLEQQQRMSK